MTNTWFIVSENPGDCPFCIINKDYVTKIWINKDLPTNVYGGDENGWYYSIQCTIYGDKQIYNLKTFNNLKDAKIWFSKLYHVIESGVLSMRILLDEEDEIK